MLTQESELGFGTEYEKVIFSGILDRLGQRYGISSYCNYPKNNLLGETKDVTGELVEKTKNPDLLWNFCEFENRKDTLSFFSDLEAFNPKHVLIVTQNKLNPGTLLHYIYHKVFGKKWDHGFLGRMTIKPIKEYSKTKKTYEILEVGKFDAPWFILDVYESGRFLKKLVPKSNHSTGNLKSSLFEHSPEIIKKWACHHNYILLRVNPS
ncbi:MAG: hypothetical protein ACQCN6_05225 [Candidatus Bathyarchaeia archaeon]|jgi:hypothetical protein